MNNSNTIERLKEITIEDYIWIVYLIIILLSYYSNNLEKNYYLFNNELAKEKYRHIIKLIFSILLVIYMYFFSSSLNSFKALNNSDNFKKISLTKLSLIASTFIFLSGIIYLYIAYVDDSIDIELAFN